MSCLRLRLPPARKAWKSFTSKLQSKLRKLNKSKAIKKPRNRESALIIEKRIQRNTTALRPYNKALCIRYHRRYLFKKKAAPVYIDRLFKGPITEVVTKNVKWVDDKEDGGIGGAGTSKEDKSSLGDDMWEALALASPQMHGIDQRADDFIRRFRAEMRLQEMIARRL